MVCRQSQIFEAVRELLDMLRADRNSLHVLAAISGGMDSMVMLQVLAELLKGGRLTCTVAHVNHRLRSESSSDEELVRAAAETQSMSFLCRQLEPRPPQTNLEAWARQERYRMLEEMRVECGAEIILTAHHRRDQAETVLMRTISGRLVTDAHSIAPYCPDRRLLRPLLNISHREIEAYAADKSVKFIQDASNSDLTRTRNYLRLSLMPQIRAELNPNLDEALSETASRLSTDEDFFEDLAERTAASFGSIVDLSKLLVLHDALLWRVCRSVAVRTCGEEARSIGYRSYQYVAASVRCGSGGGDLGRGVSFLISQGNLVFTASCPNSLPLEPGSLCIPGSICRHHSDGFQAQILATIERLDGSSAASAHPAPRADAAREFFDLDAIFSGLNASKDETALVVRERRDGDVVRVASRGSRKLKKLFQEQGVMLTLRDRIPIVELDSRILWVPGVARSEVAPVGSETRNLLVLEYRQLGPSQAGAFL